LFFSPGLTDKTLADIHAFCFLEEREKKNNQQSFFLPAINIAVLWFRNDEEKKGDLKQQMPHCGSEIRKSCGKHQAIQLLLKIIVGNIPDENNEGSATPAPEHLSHTLTSEQLR
jgi:hypothetical protein